MKRRCPFIRRNLLVDKRLDVNIQNENGRTALLEASFGGHLKAVKMLVEAGADVNLGD